MHRRCVGVSFETLLIIFLSAWWQTGAGAVGTPAGTVIECFSTARYTNAQGTLQGQAVSNTVRITVAKKAAASVSPPSRAVSSAPGRTVCVPVEVRNLGNAEDTFNLVMRPPSDWPTKVFKDDNGDGELQPTETTEVAQTPPLPPDSILKLIVKVDVPSTAREGVAASVELAARSVETSTALAVANYTINPALDTTTIALSTDPEAPGIGSTVRVSAILSPAASEALTVSVTGPDGEETQSTVTTDTNGEASLDLYADISGTWTVTATRAASATQSAVSSTLVMTCIGPTHEVDGLDMVSVPLDLVNPSVAATFGGDAPVALAKWLPQDYRYAVFNPFTGDTDDPLLQSISPGQGYWTGVPGPTAIVPVGRLVNQSQPFRIAATPGWNQIGSPFLSSTDWTATKVIYGGQSLTLAQARQQEVMLEYCWTFIKIPGAWGYELIHPTLPGARKTLEPWKSYWVFLGHDAEIELAPPVELPPVGIATATASADLETVARGRIRDRDKRRGQDPGIDNPMPQPTDDGWYLALAVSCGDMEDSGNYIGVSGDTSFDGLANPPRASSYVDLYFPEAEGSGTGLLASCVLAPSDGVQVWEFEVASTEASKEHRLEVFGLEGVPANVGLILENLTTGDIFDLRKASQCPFVLGDASRPVSFRLTAAQN